jgi:hypothetical protein
MLELDKHLVLQLSQPFFEDHSEHLLFAFKRTIELLHVHFLL